TYTIGRTQIETIKGKLKKDRGSQAHCTATRPIFVHYLGFIILADAHFSHDTPRNSVLDLPFACSPRTREPGSAPPSRRTSEVRKKTPEIDLRGPLVVDLSVPPLA